MKSVPYKYRNIPIGGGGYVTGIEFDRSRPELLYARTDIGGVYRFDRENERWISLMDHVSEADLSESFPSEIFCRDGILYITCGEYSKNCRFGISHDMGETFEFYDIPARIHGNAAGRGTGNRIAVNEKYIFYASSEDGLLRSSDGGKNWSLCTVGGEKHMTFVTDTGNGRIIVGTAGVDTRSGRVRGKSLYVSYDGGDSFEPMPQPENEDIPESAMPGLVAHRMTSDGKSFYITMTMTGKDGWRIPLSYSCDASELIGGRVLRYTPDKSGRFTEYEDITPPCKDALTESGLYPYAFGGICFEGETLLLSTICGFGDVMYLSRDGGKNWISIMDGLRGISFETSYMQPKYNGGGSLVHWMSDVKINPHDPDESWFNTGTGVFRCQNLTDEQPVFKDCCKGIEETVHLNVYSPSKGKARVIDVLGDLGGFVFEDIDKPCENTFADKNGNRFITCMNADFAERRPELITASARGNWTSETCGGAIMSTDGGKTFEHLGMPYGLSEKIDMNLDRIRQPNRNSGWTAVSADGETVVWCICTERDELPADMVVYTEKPFGGYKKSRVLAGDGTDFKGGIKVFSDRQDPDVFYGFGSDGELFVSRDRGAVFKFSRVLFSGADFTRIDFKSRADIKPSGRFGEFFISTGEKLYKMSCDGENAELSEIDCGIRVFRIGVGAGKNGASDPKKTLYVYGCKDGEYGFYRMEQSGNIAERISNKNQLFGDINSIAGDGREYGVFYIGSASRGLLCGMPE